MRSAQIEELVDGQAGLANDGPQEAAWQVLAAVERHGNAPARIVFVDEQAVASGAPGNKKPCTVQGAEDVLR